MNSNVTGTMKGTITNVHTGAETPFLSTSVGRHNDRGHLNVFGDQSGPWETIAFALVDEDTPSGEYAVGSSKLVRVIYVQQPFGPMFAAASGSLNFQNHQPEASINGRLNFRVHSEQGERFDVDVVFAIEGIDQVS